MLLPDTPFIFESFFNALESSEEEEEFGCLSRSARSGPGPWGRTGEGTQGKVGMRAGWGARGRPPEEG